MRKVIYGMSISLDGYIEDAMGSLSWHIIDDELHTHFNQLESLIDMHLYGRQLYEVMAAYWPEADKIPSAPQVADRVCRNLEEQTQDCILEHTRKGRLELQVSARGNRGRGEQSSRHSPEII